MSDQEPIAELVRGLQHARMRPRAPGRRSSTVLAESEMFWLSTVRRDGRPHVTPLPAIWLDGDAALLHGIRRAEDEEPGVGGPLRPDDGHRTSMRSGPRRRGRRYRDPRRPTTRSCGAWPTLWKSKLDWDFEVGDDEFRDPDGRHGFVFGVAPVKVLAFGKGEPYSQTRYRFV